MKIQDSLQLFSKNAFNKDQPENGYEELSNKAVDYAKGIPLALKVLGSFLRSKNKDEWDSALKKLKKIPNAEIQDVLKFSYDELDDNEKNIFLDIACCLRGYERRWATTILNACDSFAKIGIRNLLDKALITITPLYNYIEMHDLIQEMGRDIVRKECIKNPGARSRLWDPEEVRDVLKNNRGTDAVEAISLDMTKISNMHLSSEAFRKMPNLRFLAFEGRRWDGKIINSVQLRSGPESLSNNLRYVRWDGFPLKSLASTFCSEKLVELYMQGSNVEELWNGEQNLPSLKIIDLQGSTRLIECPNLSGAPNLIYVSLNRYESLSHVHPSIFSLQKLVMLSVRGCHALKSLCSNSCSPFLLSLIAWDCPNLQEFSVPIKGDRPPILLYLGSTALNGLPSSIFHLRNLHFDFPISDGLMDLPENFAHDIILSDSRRNERDTLIALRTVLPSPVFRYVRSLTFIHCRTLSELPDNIWLLSSLEKLELLESHVISLPKSIKYLPRLTYLDVSGSEMLQSVPALPPSIQWFDASGCKSLKAVLSSTSEPSQKHKCTFLFEDCIKLDQDAHDTILKDAIVRIEHGAKPLSAIVLEDKEDAYPDDDAEIFVCGTVKSGMICYLLPARIGKVGDGFHHCSTEASSFTIELPPSSKFLDFFFYLVLTQVQSCHIDEPVNVGCECYMETSWGEKVDITSFFIHKHFLLYPKHSIMSDHVCLWYDAQFCKQIMEAIKERKLINEGRTTYNPKLAFKFFARSKENEEAVIKECGLRWIFEDQIREEGRGRKSKRSREIHELEGSAVQNGVKHGFKLRLWSRLQLRSNLRKCGQLQRLIQPQLRLRPAI